MDMHVSKFASSHVSALVIDDDDVARSLLVRLLTVMGAKHVYEADNGIAGLQQVFSDKLIHFVICDLYMQPMDGMSVIGAIRGSMKRQIYALPLIVFTGAHDGDQMKRIMGAGATAAFPKPFSPAELSGYLCGVMKTHWPKMGLDAKGE